MNLRLAKTIAIFAAAIGISIFVDLLPSVGDEKKPIQTFSVESFAHWGSMPQLTFLSDDRKAILANPTYTGSVRGRVDVIETSTGKVTNLIDGGEILDVATHGKLDEFVVAKNIQNEIIVSHCDHLGNEEVIGSLSDVKPVKVVRIFWQPNPSRIFLLLGKDLFRLKANAFEMIVSLPSEPSRRNIDISGNKLFVAIKRSEIRAYNLNTTKLVSKTQINNSVSCVGAISEHQVAIGCSRPGSTIYNPRSEIGILKLGQNSFEVERNSAGIAWVEVIGRVNFIEHVTKKRFLAGSYVRSSLIDWENGELKWSSNLHGRLTPSKQKVGVVDGLRFAMLDASTGERISPEQGHSHPVLAMKIDEDSSSLLSMQYDGLICQWDLESGRIVSTDRVGSGTYMGGSLTQNRYFVADPLEKKKLRILTRRKGKFKVVDDFSFSEIKKPSHVAPMTDGGVITLSNDSTLISIFDPLELKSTLTINATTAFDDSNRFSKFEQFLVTDSGVILAPYFNVRDGFPSKTRVIRASDGKLLYDIEVSITNLVSCNSNADLLAYVDGNLLVLRRLFSGELISKTKVVHPHSKNLMPFHQTGISPDGKLVSVAISPLESEKQNKLVNQERQSGFILVSVDSGEIVDTFLGHRTGITSFQFSDDSKQVFSADQFGVINLWEIDQ